jgi:ABC-type Fe3+/spermidine/putrescine transport system ATPase subunit
VEGRAGDGTWWVQSALGRHLATSAEDAHGQGDEVVLAIRPERIDIAAEPFADGQGFAVTLQSRYFLGPYAEYFLHVGDQVLRAQSSASRSGKAGTRLYARVEPEHCQIVAGGIDSSHDD